MDTNIYDPIQIRMWKGDGDGPKPVLFLMDYDATPGFILSYEAFGEHNEASMDFYRKCRPLKKEEQERILREHFGGYSDSSENGRNLLIVQKDRAQFRAARWK